MVKVVYIAHPISGDVEGNRDKVLSICKELHSKGCIPLAPYLVALSYLDDEVVEERELGIAANIEHFTRRVMDEVWVCGDRISAGMREEIKLAFAQGIPVMCRTPSLHNEVLALQHEHMRTIAA